MEILSLSLFAFILVFFMLGIKIVPQSKNYVVERLGRYARTLEAGLHVIIPILETIRHKVDILETQLPTNEISTITLDNVTIEIELAILYRVVKAENAVYRISDLEQGSTTEMQMRGIQYDIGLPDTIFSERSLRKPPQQWLRKQ